jgi:hypothetical protein
MPVSSGVDGLGELALVVRLLAGVAVAMTVRTRAGSALATLLAFVAVAEVAGIRWNREVLARTPPPTSPVTPSEGGGRRSPSSWTAGSSASPASPRWSPHPWRATGGGSAASSPPPCPWGARTRR